MAVKIRTLLCSLALLLVTQAFAQSGDDKIDLEDVDVALLEQLVYERINEYRLSNDLDELLRNDILDEATQTQADYNLNLKRVDTKDDIGKRVEKAGGTANAQGLAAYVSAGKGKDRYTYNKIANDVVAKFSKSKKSAGILMTPDYYYTGIGIAIDAGKKRVYVSQVFGRVNVLNTGADKKLRKTLSVPYSKKKRGLAPQEERACKGCKKFSDYQGLLNGVYLDGNKVYLEYDDMKGLKKLLRKADDGLAVDIVSKEQYQCGGENIYNSELPSKGWMTKPAYSAKMWKKNEVEGPRPKSYKGMIGKVKKKVIKKLPDDYEMNVVVIQGKNTL